MGSRAEAQKEEGPGSPIAIRRSFASAVFSLLFLGVLVAT